jgi:hypothetical protein
MIQGWAKIKGAANYAGVKERTLRSWVREGLKHSRLPSGTILIKFAWIDEFLEGFQAKEHLVDSLVEETLKEFRR